MPPGGAPLAFRQLWHDRIDKRIVPDFGRLPDERLGEPFHFIDELLLPNGRLKRSPSVPRRFITERRELLLSQHFGKRHHALTRERASCRLKQRRFGKRSAFDAVSFRFNAREVRRGPFAFL